MLRIREYIYFPAEDGKTMNRRKVDLKELEKFGYLKEDKLYVKKICKTSDYTWFEVFVNIHTREIYACDGYSFSFHINDEDIKKYIDDLIQAGLVEEVKE